MNKNSRALGGKNGWPGVLPLAVEASFFLEFLVPFVSRQKTQNVKLYLLSDVKKNE